MLSSLFKIYLCYESVNGAIVRDKFWFIYMLNNLYLLIFTKTPKDQSLTPCVLLFKLVDDI